MPTIVMMARTDGEITNLYSFIRSVAQNVYADFSNNRRKYADTYYGGDADEVLQFIADKGKGMIALSCSALFINALHS